MKNISKYIAILILTACLTSCSETFFDVNRDPDASTKAEVETLIPFIFATIASTNVMENNPPVQFFTQLWSSGGSTAVFVNPEQGTLSNLTVRNSWDAYYGSTLRNLTLAVNQLKDATLARDINIRAQCKMLQAYAYYQLTTFFGDVPFTESLRSDITAPKFDTQKTVLEGVVAKINEALAEFDATKTGINTSGDLLYAGNLNNWVRFANSLKLQALMLLVNRDASYATQITALESSPMIVENTQNANLPFFETPGNTNNVYRLLELFGGNENDPQDATNVYLFASTTILDLMNDLNDPRIPTFFKKGKTATNFVGATPTVSNANRVLDFARINDEVHFTRTSPFQVISASEIILLRAECIAKGYFAGGLTAAETELKKGIKTNLDFWNATRVPIAESSKTTYLDQAIFDIDGGTLENALEVIQTQQYLDGFNRLYAWTNWRRTKVPALAPGTNSVVNTIVRRYPTSDTELLTNPNAPAASAITVPMWFEKP
jgi:hypothetical protein